MPEPLRKFVVLHHVFADSAHWDLMLDTGQALATWQLTSDPGVLADPASRSGVAARRIGDHRRAYLDHEGSVSGNRGRVTRCESGTYELVSEAQQAWTIRLEGTMLRGLFRITAIQPGAAGIVQRVDE